ncbi:MAG: glycosyltransferase [Aurantimicrobium sp.]|uniref:glycosyltransferase n=2 Tax=Aurantimicrobium sp. TaxID=1930784 RepID=UPI002FC5BD91
MPKPLRILIGCDTFGPNVNGAAKFAERLAAGLVERGHDVRVMAPAAGRKSGTWVETHEGQPMTMYRIKSWRWYPHDWLRYMIPWRVRHNSARVLDSFKPDVVHFQSHLIVGGGLTKEAELRGIRIIGTNHFMPENMMQFTLLPGPTQRGVIRLVWKAAARTFGRAEAVTTPTRRAANFLEEYTQLTDVHAISCGINAHHYTPNFDTDGENRIVFVGRITGEKKLDVLLKAFRKLPPELNASLEFVGGGDQLQPMKQLVSHLGLNDKVTFTGYVSDDELKASLTRAKVFAMPSIAELQSIATMEAMATALPIVGANAMALPHLIHDGENGYLFEPNDVDDLRDKLVKVLTADKEELLRMKNNSLKFIRGHDITRTLDTFEALYRGQVVVDPDPELTDD